MGGAPGMGGGRPQQPQMDPEMVFNMLVKISGGTDTQLIRFDNIPDATKQTMKMMTERSGGIPLPESGTWNKNQFLEHYQRSLAQSQARNPAAGMGGAPGMGGGMGPGGFDVDAMAEQRFRQSDVNGDGRITMDEASSRLKPVFQDVDTNRDGVIDLAEYKAYMASLMGNANNRGQNGPNGGFPGAAPMGDPSGGFGPNGYGDPNGGGFDKRGGRDREEKKEPEFAVRFGKLPEGLPSWWEELDTDKDGQIGLYEWRAAGRDMKTFQDYDLNGDQLLAPEEFVRFEKLKAEDAKLTAIENGEAPARGPGGYGSKGAGSGPGASGKAAWPPAPGSGMPGGNKGFPDMKGKDDKDKGGSNPFRNGGGNDKKNK